MKIDAPLEDRSDSNAGDARKAALKMDARTFRETGHELVDTIADLLETLPERPLTPGEHPDAVRAALGGDGLPDGGQPAAEVVRSTAEFLIEHSLYNGHPRFWGYITSSPAPIGMLADFLAAAVNPNVGGWLLSPAASEIEAQTVRWIAELTGYPVDCGGLLVSGGNVANAVGLLAARVASAPWNIREEGQASPGAPRLRVYASRETHTWIENATDLSGLGTDAVRWIPTDDDLRMDVAQVRDVLKRDRDAGDVPMAVVGTAGTVSTGAVDPIAALADLCREENVWLHVDGAYGGFAAAVPGAPEDLRALGRADSVALDPHKWLYAPLEAGCVLVRDPELLRNAFSYHPPYYHFGVEAINYHDYGPQNSRGFRALKVWMGLRQAGRRGYERMIGDDMELSRRLFATLEGHPSFEAITQSLSIATFRYVPPDLAGRAGEASVASYLNRLNETLLDRIQSSGLAFVSNAVIGERYVLRACIVNFNTTAEDVDALPGIVDRLGAEVDEALREAT